MHASIQPERRPGSASSGFAFLGVALGLFALAVASIWAVPAWQQAQRTARARTVIADLRSFEAAFQAYAQAQGDWPAAATAPGEMPKGMDAALKSTRWTERTPLGGRYAWLPATMQRGQHLPAVVGIVSIAGDVVSDDPDQLKELLLQARNAGLPANRLRLGYRNEPIYVLEN